MCVLCFAWLPFPQRLCVLLIDVFLLLSSLQQFKRSEHHRVLSSSERALRSPLVSRA